MQEQTHENLLDESELATLFCIDIDSNATLPDSKN